MVLAGAVSRSASDAVNSKLATIASTIALVVGAGVLLSGFGVALPFSFSLALHLQEAQLGITFARSTANCQSNSSLVSAGPSR